MHQTNFKLISSSSVFPQHILDSIRYIHEHYQSDLSLEHLAQTQHLNKCYLCNLFKHHTSMTVTDFINKFRLEKSKYALQHTDESVLNISLNVGFNNVTYYNRLFKRAYGTTPLQYRTSTQAKNSLTPIPITVLKIN